MKKEFNPDEWLSNEGKKESGTATGPASTNSLAPADSPASENNRLLPSAPYMAQAGRSGQQVPDLGTGNQNTAASIEAAVQALEASGIDITAAGYADWRDLAFALVHELNENGREYFHRISRFNASYNQKECDAQYSSCLKSNGSGITIATFFHHLKQAGISVATSRFQNQTSISHGPATIPSHTTAAAFSGPQQVLAEAVPSGELAQQGDPGIQQPGIGDAATPEEAVPELPVFPASLYASIPEFLQKVVAPASSPEERDLLLLGSLTAMSACLPTLYGIYDGKKVFPNLYLFVTAPASAGKGRLSFCKQLVLPIHKKMREQAKVLKHQYASELAEFNMNQKDAREKPAKPPERMLFIPANNSTTGVFQLLADNEGRGLIFETEGDTLSQSFKSDYGNYSDGFRKAFHHETISYYRRTDREYVDVEMPCLSTVLSGTPKQVTSLIPNAENGLFSRFLFYHMNLKPVFKEVFALRSEHGIDQYYLQLGEEFLELHKTLNNMPGVRINLSLAQEERFMDFFTHAQNKYLNLQNEDYVATVRRLGLITFRLAMLLTALRIMEDGEIAETRQCQDRDFEAVLSMVTVLLRHSSKVFSSLPEDINLPRRDNKKESFLEALPREFGRKEYLSIALSQGLAEKPADRIIEGFLKAKLILRVGYNQYENPSKEEAVDDKL